MDHEKTIINKSGDKVKIQVNFWLNHRTPVYDVQLYICKKGTRKFKSIDYGDDFSYRALTMEKKREFTMQKYLEIVDIEDINEAKKELHQLLAPTF